jgi:hypothetical protein
VHEEDTKLQSEKMKDYLEGIDVRGRKLTQQISEKYGTKCEQFLRWLEKTNIFVI